MGCAPSGAANTTSRKKETHDDGRPLTDITDDGLNLVSSYVHHSEETAGASKPKTGLEEGRDEAVDDLAEFFLYDDFHVSTKPPKKVPFARPPPTETSVNQGSGKAGNVKKAVWGEFIIDDGIGAFPSQKESNDDTKPTSPQPEPSSSPENNGSTSRSAVITSPTSPVGGKMSPIEKKPYRTLDKFTVKTAIGHGSRVKCIAIAPGEKEYVSCSNEDTSITMFGLTTGRELGMFTGHQDTIINSTFSYDGKYLATTSRDHTMILWDVVTTKQILTFEHGKVVICCCFSKDSKYVATGCQDKVCRVWETRKGREVLIFAQHEGIIIAMCYAPDNSHIVSASADKTLRVWSSTNGRCKHLLQGHAGIVLSCVYTADGKRIVSNDEKLLRVWNANDGTCTLSLNVDEVAKIPKGPAQRKVTWTLSTAAPGDFGHYVIVACNNRFVYILDAENKGQEVTSHFCKAPVYCLAMGHNNRAAVGDSFGNVYHFHFQSRDDFRDPNSDKPVKIKMKE